MQVEQNISLKQYNSFGIDVKAKWFAIFHNTGELQQALSLPANDQLLILGGGSNILFISDVNGLVLKNEIKGIEKVKEDDVFVWLKAGAGENWHQFVMFCVKNGWGGVENLSLIPGNIGAAPIQNIGAYGVELGDVFDELEAWHVKDRASVVFSKADCAFGYRESIFKQKYKNQFVILNVTCKLRKQPVLNTNYGAISQELAQMGITEPSIRHVSQAVINIRSSKLPNPQQIGNAGSFFKNPVVSKQQYNELKKHFENIVGYPNTNGTVKLAAGWLIEHCGPTGVGSWKGYRRGDAGCYSKQALVLVNYGNATGKEIYNISTEIVQTVKAKFGVELEREVNIVGS